MSRRAGGVLVLNAGSSSLKFSLMDGGGRAPLARGFFDRTSSPGTYAFGCGDGPARAETVRWPDFHEAVLRIVHDLRESTAFEPDAVAHRVVHGGTRFTRAVLVTPEVRAALAGLVDLAPLHNPVSLEVLDTALESLPDMPHVAVFDTAFHSTLSPEAYTYPLPGEWTERWGLRRFGFHGLSHAYSASRAAELLGRAPADLRLVVAHLGQGASVTAVAGGRSVDTSMGFTPLEGLMMGTRSGSVDPGLLLHLQLRCGVSASELERALNHASGLLGVSGVSSDMRSVIEASRKGDEKASLAVRIFAHRTRQAIGSMAVTLGGVDALVFTGGIGEHSVEIRSAVCRGLDCLGLRLDAGRNASACADAVVSSDDSPGRILVVTAREDVMMARAAADCLGAAVAAGS